MGRRVAWDLCLGTTVSRNVVHPDLSVSPAPFSITIRCPVAEPCRFLQGSPGSEILVGLPGSALQHWKSQIVHLGLSSAIGETLDPGGLLGAVLGLPWGADMSQHGCSSYPCIVFFSVSVAQGLLQH